MQETSEHRCLQTIGTVTSRPVTITSPTLSRPRAPRGAYVSRSIGTALLLLLASATPGRAQRRASSGDLLVLAASSLTDVLPRIASAWADGGNARVSFSFDATSRLAPQAMAGAQADVFVAADDRWMRWLEDGDVVEAGDARIVASNELVVIVAHGAPAPAGPQDLGSLERIALGGENVPAGRYAREALARAGVWDRLGDRVVAGGSARSVLEWVARGEVPVGIVYRTDAVAEPAVDVAFAFDAASHQPIRYWAAPLGTSDDPAVARAFVEYLSSPEAAALFAAAGFAPASSVQRLEPRLPGTESVVVLPSVRSAIRLSLLVAFMATLAGLVPSVGLGWVLARRDFPGKAIVSTLVLAPLVIPPVVTGFLLLSVLGTRSPLGRLLASLGLPIPFTLLGATVAAFIVGIPLYVISIRGAFEAVDPLYEELSWTLGVPPKRTFFRVSLPLALPGIVAGAVLAFARALGEFGATVVLAGNVEGSTRTIALAVYTLLEAPSGRETMWVLVGASVTLSLVALLGFETLSRRQRRRLDGAHGR